MIVFNNVTKYYKSNVGIENVSVKINKGDFVFLVGPSGAGKSTFIKLILKEIDADSGSIKVRGNEVTTLSNRQVPKLRRNIGIVFQDFRLLPKKTVYENVAFAMEIIHQPKKLIRKYVPQVLSMVGIASKADKYPDELSAGEQQREFGAYGYEEALAEMEMTDDTLQSKRTFRSRFRRGGDEW